MPSLSGLRAFIESETLNPFKHQLTNFESSIFIISLDSSEQPYNSFKQTNE